MKIKIHICYQDTRTNNEDFVLTPYLFLVANMAAKAYGLGLCWGYKYVKPLCAVGFINTVLN